MKKITAIAVTVTCTAAVGGAIYAAEHVRSLTDGQAVGGVLLTAMMAATIIGVVWERVRSHT